MYGKRSQIHKIEHGEIGPDSKLKVLRDRELGIRNCVREDANQILS